MNMKLEQLGFTVCVRSFLIWLGQESLIKPIPEMPTLVSQGISLRLGFLMHKAREIKK